MSAPPPPLRVLVVDDSPTVRGRIVEVLGAAPGIAVVGQAASGDEAVELCRALRPDVLTLDVVLPGCSGVVVTEWVMAYCPTPILIVSGSSERGEAFRTHDALAAGAVDVLDKPGAGGGDPEAWARELVARVRLVARVTPIPHVAARRRARWGGGSRPPASPATRDLADPDAPSPALGEARLVAIGASTGGTRAVAELLAGLPADFPLPVLLVLHLSPLFGESFAEWLAGRVPFPVALARDGEPLPPPGACRVVVAPPGRHLVVRGGRLRLDDGPERHSCRPAVDALFESLAAELGPGVIACLLTGMGRDGASGLLRLRQAGALTLAQDEATSTVYGMPAEAARLGAAREVLPLPAFAATLVAAAAHTGSGA
ncbi:MAG: chemotaxis-specific protein-glutamate methyltransferase CheB [Planctomycetota bacterium]